VNQSPAAEVVQETVTESAPTAEEVPAGEEAAGDLPKDGEESSASSSETTDEDASDEAPEAEAEAPATTEDSPDTAAEGESAEG
jgi:hypothetical protein